MAKGRAQGAGFFDRQPWLAPPPVGLGHCRNGMPGVLPYTWRRGEAQRDQEVAARLAAVRAELRAMAHGPTCTCRLCIEQYGPIPPPPPEREARHG